ncbi:MAG: tRNA (N(6)-L-threonylcarbamoyladenosine(37)-C(2))-methylthiotransferase [Euryarchaeota archaeon]|nr:tRNA (N(6)-L-threonylcarbamoyladenosine(37)-C(2))-methylthiotransferase [Euryarchaeota archaeon]
MPSDAQGSTLQPRRVRFETYGCTTNLGDTRTMEGILASRGHTLVGAEEDADVVVVNTCTVVDTTEERMEDRIAALRAEGKEIVVAGCMAAAQPDEVRRHAPDAPLLSPRHLHHIDAVVEGRPFTPEYRPKSGLPRAYGPTDAVIQVSEGCLFTCSYCITKHARGDQTSYPIDDIVQDVRDAVHAGAIDIKITSQDTSGFGFDTGRDPDASLPGLVRRITEIGRPGDFRLRVGMMHPRTANEHLDALLDAMDHPNVYKFLHLPIQTGSERILKAMARGHTIDQFWDTIEAYRARFPTGWVSTDIICAFPGETERDHQATLELLRRLKPEHVNITRFSARPGTPAKTLTGRVDTAVAKQRSKGATNLVWSMWDTLHKKRIGDHVEVFVTEPGKKEESVLGRGPNCEPVIIRRSEEEVPLGTRLVVEIVDAKTTYFIGEPRSGAVPVGRRRG